MGRRAALFTETDLKRALKVLRDEQCTHTHQVAVRPDGSIVIEPVQQTAENTAHDRQGPSGKPTLHLVKEDQIAL